MCPHLNVSGSGAGRAVGGGDDPPAADQAAPAPDIVMLIPGDQPRLPGVLIHLGVHAPHNPSPSLGQAAVA